MIIKGLATGIGSLPYKDYSEALDLVFEYCPQVPFWPQLPKKDVREGMMAQFSENLPCLKVSGDGLYFDGRAQDSELERFYEQIISNNIEHFKIGRDFAVGLHGFYQRLEKVGVKDVQFIKCHVVGPFTFAAGINDAQGVALLHDPMFMQVILKGLAMKALWQVNFFRKFAKPVIVFIDEPYLGCFGSAYTALNKDDVIKGLCEFTDSLRSDDVTVGVHCCGNTDWSIFTATKGIGIINFDAFNFLDKVVLYADELKGFLARGGVLGWGIVPTQEFNFKTTPDALMDKLLKGIDVLVKKGIDRGMLLNQLLLTPACGLGSLDTKYAEGILQLLSKTSQAVKNLLT